MHAAEGKVPTSLSALLSVCLDAALGQADPFPVWTAKASIWVGAFSLSPATAASQGTAQAKIRLVLLSGLSVTK